MPRASENISRGLALAAQIGLKSKEKFQDLIEKNRSRLDYQRFQQLQQDQSQAFQAEEARKARQQRLDIFNKNYALAQRAEGRAEDAATATATYRKNQVNRNAKNNAWERFKYDSGLMQRNIETLQIALRQEAGKNELSNPDRIASLQREIDFKQKAFNNFINTEGQKFDLSRRGKTLSELDDEVKAKRLARIEQSSKAFQELFPQGIIPNLGTPEGMIKTMGDVPLNQTFSGMLQENGVSKKRVQSIEVNGRNIKIPKSEGALSENGEINIDVLLGRIGQGFSDIQADMEKKRLIRLAKRRAK